MIEIARNKVPEANFLVGDMIDSGNLSVNLIKEKFMSVTNVLSVILEDIPTLL